MALIKGITVKLEIKAETGKDAFGVPIFSEQTEEVNNVLVTPLTAEEIAEDLEYHKKRTVYELSIPKSDTHSWENTTVLFWGKSWETVGNCKEWISENVPLKWNRKIRVARYG